MISVGDFHDVGWQALSVLWLFAENKTERNTYKTESDDSAKCKKDLKPFVAINCHLIIKNRVAPLKNHRYHVSAVRTHRSSRTSCVFAVSHKWGLKCILAFFACYILRQCCCIIHSPDKKCPQYSEACTLFFYSSTGCPTGFGKDVQKTEPRNKF